MNFRNLLICLMAFYPCGALFAAEPVEVMSLEQGAVPPPARIEDISWLQGHWIGQGLGGTAEDVISPAADGQMMPLVWSAGEFNVAGSGLFDPCPFAWNSLRPHMLSPKRPWEHPS